MILMLMELAEKLAEIRLVITESVINSHSNSSCEVYLICVQSKLDNEQEADLTWI